MIAAIRYEQDFRNPYAEKLLKRYRNAYRVFNDDIQGTGSSAVVMITTVTHCCAGAVTLAGLLAALRRTKMPLTECRIVCLGAGSAGLGVCNTLVYGVLLGFRRTSWCSRSYSSCSYDANGGEAGASISKVLDG